MPDFSGCKIIGIYIPLLPLELESGKIDNILRRHGFSHQFPSNYLGRYLSLNADERNFHYFKKVRKISGGNTNDYGQKIKLIKVNDFEEAKQVLKKFIADNPSPKKNPKLV